MQIYDILIKDHRKVTKLLEQLIDFDKDSKLETRNQLINKIREELIPHSRAEETVLYNTMREIKPTSDLVSHGYQEHIKAEALLRTLQLQDRVDAGWHSTAFKLKETLDHHINEEEHKIFDAAKNVFTGEEAEMMGQAFENLKPQITKEGFVTTTIELIANLMPARFAKSFRNFNLENRINRNIN